MPKLAKNYYRTASGEKKVNCYMVNIPKELVKSTNIEDDDDIMIYTSDNKIIIQKSNHFTTRGVISKYDLDELIDQYGTKYVLTMYANRKFNMTQSQLDYVLNYTGNKNGKEI